MNKLPEGNYCAYLRKSRADLESESRGEEDTYAKHERIIFDLATRWGIKITEVYKEKPITGERISARPEMLKLLEDIEDEKWTGVVVVEVERLARGDTMDQGIVAQAFKYSSTLIVTPQRIYDPNDQNDEEYFEFGLFMSRREFKTITRRLQSGRVGSVKDGKYVGNQPPYGYNRKQLQKGGFTLEPHPEQAPIVQLIFSLYTDPDPDKRMGTSRLARHLNNVLKVPTARKSKWTVATINGIIRNPVYMGHVRWGSRPAIKKKNSSSRPRKPRDSWTEAEGLHESIIDEITWNRAQQIMQANSHPPAPKGVITNPLAGLVRCDMCGGAVVRKPYTKIPPMIMCSTQDCKNVSSYFHKVEERLIQALRKWVEETKAQLEIEQEQHDEKETLKIKALQGVYTELKKRFGEIEEQRNNLDELLEKKMYTFEKYTERTKVLEARRAEVKTSLDEAEEELTKEERRIKSKYETVPRVERVIDAYEKSDSAAEKNAHLKEIVESIRYRKEKGGRWSGVIDEFELFIDIKIQ